MLDQEGGEKVMGSYIGPHRFERRGHPMGNRAWWRGRHECPQHAAQALYYDA